ncbi:MAG: thymidylate kinase [Melioribacteraceae bacterium]|nr:MAG: thymidylate kinase [Melioribacteraceae bacterium]
MFITFEGIDYSGKSTQVRLLEEYYQNLGKEVLLIREPGGTKISEKIRDLLLDKKNMVMTEKTEALLFAAARAQLVNEVIKPALERGAIVISDRFHHSSIAYQGYGRNLDLHFVENLQYFAISDTVPDITFFIHITLDEVARRKMENNRGGDDRIELSKDEFYHKVIDGYIKLSESDPKMKLIDGTKRIKTIHSDIVDILNSLSA